MFIMHIALQGCLRARNVPYGLTPDTGGHIRYLLELVAAAEKADPSLRQELVVRRFESDRLGLHYARRDESISPRSRIVRIDGASTDYIAKEDMRFETPILAEALEAHLRSLPRLPDVLHGHYADGGQLAVEIKRRFGIPVMFTAHSLGRVKAQTLGIAAPSGALADRIATEERVIAAADQIVASSMDEAELQYGAYRATWPERIRINPPGCDLAAFAPPDIAPTLDTAPYDRFLADASKPPVLALARPVHKKNLAGLVRAFGETPALRERANLVIHAGNRTRIAGEDAETRAVLEELLRLVDDYDLWGHVALPKTHRPCDVPAIYAHAAARRGIFVNVALNEPFGLTFLEAAASGLPVVATNRGGPNDILGRCRNGTLVDPTDTAAIGAAMLHLLEDGSAWDAAAMRGRAGCAYYAWDRHARDYLADARWLMRRPALATGTNPQPRTMLVCDIDNTLTGDRDALGRLTRWIVRHPRTAYGIATGRSLHSAIEIIRRWDIPVPRFLISSVGSEIYWVHDDDFRDVARDKGWPDLAPDDWTPDGIVATLSGIDGLSPQAPREQRTFKRSYFLTDTGLLPGIRRALRRAGQSFEMVYSHGRYLDILPRGVSKGHAIHAVAETMGIAQGDIWAAGDSGNDALMLEMVGRPIIVGNHTPELAHLRKRTPSYFSQAHFAAGVLEGLHHDWSPVAARNA